MVSFFRIIFHNIIIIINSFTLSIDYAIKCYLKENILEVIVRDNNVDHALRTLKKKNAKGGNVQRNEKKKSLRKAI